MKLYPGDKLPNGATVIAYRAKEEHEGVVLAIVPSEPDDRPVDAYASWRYGEPDDMSKPPMTWSGHYHDDIAEAVADFEER